MNYSLLEGKYLLLDTNVVINVANYGPSMQRDLLDPIDMAGTRGLILDNMVRFEFLCGAASFAEAKTLKTWVAKLFKLTEREVDIMGFLPVTDQIFLDAIEISNLYSYKLKNLKASMADCFLAAQMRKLNDRSQRAILVSSDHSDFPHLFFDRIGIQTIDLGDSILNIGFYSFNAENFQKILAEYRGK